MKNLSELSVNEFVKISIPWKKNGFSFSDFYSFYEMGVSLESAIKIREENKNNGVLELFQEFKKNI
jgi:hypothetical protein